MSPFFLLNDNPLQFWAMLDNKALYTNRYGMNEMNKFPLMGMMRMEEACQDKISTKKCLKLKKKGKCSDKKVAKKCKKTCELCDDGQGKIFRYNPSCFMSLGGFPVSLPRENWVKCDIQLWKKQY